MIRAGYSSSEPALTPRMRDVLESAAAGRTVAETALELHLSVATVQTIRSAAIARLQARSFTAAVVDAYRRGELHT